jgi:hypothetical protein
VEELFILTLIMERLVELAAVDKVEEQITQLVLELLIPVEAVEELV